MNDSLLGTFSSKEGKVNLGLAFIGGIINKFFDGYFFFRTGNFVKFYWRKVLRGLLLLISKKSFGGVAFKIDHFVELIVDEFSLIFLVDVKHEGDFLLVFLDEGLVGTSGSGIFFALFERSS